MSHHCHAHKCTVPTRPSLFMCPPHWRRLPYRLKQAILSAYRRGQERDKQPSLAYVTAAHAAQLWLAEREYPQDVAGLRQLYERVEQSMARQLAGKAALDEIEIVRIGEDPFGRGEETVFYRNPAIDPARVLYCWVNIWPASWPSLAGTQRNMEVRPCH